VGRERVAGEQLGPPYLLRRGTGMTNAKKLGDKVAAEADTTASEAMSAGALATRPNKPVTVSTRVTPADAEAIDVLAAELAVPAAALVRGWILAALAVRREESVPAVLDRLTADVQRLRELVV